MNKVQEYLKSKNINTHTFVAIALFMGAAYLENPELKALVDGFVAQHPNLSVVLNLALLAYAKYSHSSKQEGNQ